MQLCIQHFIVSDPGTGSIPLLRRAPLLVIIIFLHMPLLTKAQASNSIEGSVKDSSQHPLPYVSVILTRYSAADTGIVKIILTDTTGGFVFTDIAPGRYSVCAEQLGRKTSCTAIFTIDSLKKQYQLNILYLQPLAKTLTQVEVSAQKPLVEHRADRLIYNLANSALLQGTDALDALSLVPGVITGAGIRLVGKSDVQLMVDRRLLPIKGADLLNYLKAIPSDNIERIEVITTPPAKYDAEGNAGIIAIIMKKNRQDGYNGNIRTSFTQASRAKADGSASLNYRKAKWNLYGSFFNVTGSSRPTEKLDVQYPLQQWYQDSRRTDKSSYTSYQAGFDYTISKNSAIGVTYFGYYSRPHMSEENLVTIFGKNTGGIDSLVASKNEMKTGTLNHALNANYITPLNSRGMKLEVNADYFGTTNLQKQELQSGNFLEDGSPLPTVLNAKSRSDLQLHISSIKADFELPTKFASLSFGTKASFVNTNSNYLFENLVNAQYQRDEGKSNEFNYKERTQALYINAGRKADKFDMQAGLRGEYTQTRGHSRTLGQSNSRDYAQLFPTGYLQYSLNAKHVFSISYGRRISRPGFSNLNPFRFYFNPYRYSEGNPFLNPSFNNNWQLDYTLLGKYVFSAYYSVERDDIDQVPYTNPANGDFYFFISNVGKSRSWGLSTSVPVDITKWWKTNHQFNLYNYHFISSYLKGVETGSRFTAYISHRSQLTLWSKKKLSAEFAAAYYFPRNEGVSRIGNTLNMSVGIRKISGNGRFSYALNGSDLFYRSTPTVKTTTTSFSSKSTNLYDTRNIRLTIGYRFGSNTVKTKRQHSDGIGDEKGRVN